MRSAAERIQINRTLGRAGLATLDDPRGVVQQLAFLVTDHDQFRRLLTKCEPEHRREMYAALVPNLRFTAKPLDVYLSEAARDAEARQLPTLGEGGKLIPFRPAEVRSDEYLAQQAVESEMATHHLTLTCRKCTRQETFSGMRKADAVQAARLAGWTYDEMGGTGFEICPDCPGAN
jgi:hypothetical protein